MAKIKITFSEDHISLIKNLNFKEINDSKCCIDTYDLWGGTFIYEQMALILGKMDKMYPGSDCDPLGPNFDDETLEYFNKLDSFIVEHLKDIIDILLQFCNEGIQTNVEYWCYDHERIWHKS